MTFDNLEELQKIHDCFPGAHAVLRILGDDSRSKEPFGSKFGARVPDETDMLLQRAKELNIKVVGVSFHVGSGAFCSEGFINSIKMARSVFDKGVEFGYKMDFLDIGGGWPGSDDQLLSFSSLAKDIAPVIDELFPNEVRVIAEPGRYFATECTTLAVSIIAKRTRVINEGEKKKTIYQYYLSDGIYGSFNNIIFDHFEPNPLILHSNTSVVQHDSPTSDLRDSTMFGPTCDSLDVIMKEVKLPNLEIGDWLYFTNMGAYTMASASSFNGFKTPTPIYIVR